MQSDVTRRAAMAALAACLQTARAEDAQPLRIIVPTPPGGLNDGVVRALQEPLQRLLGRTIIVDYKPGAGSSLGSAFVARSKPDGNTLLVNNNAVLINPLISRTTGYAIEGLTPLGVAAIGPLVLMANAAAIPSSDVRGFIDFAKKQPQPIAYASSGGVGSLGHLAMESFARSAGIKLLHVPYAGTAPSQQAVISGEAPLVMTSLTPAMKAQVDLGKVRLLGVASAKATPLVPGVAPINDAVPGFVVEAWFGLFAPALTEAATLNKIQQALMQVLAMPETKALLANLSVQPVAIGPVPFAEMIGQENRRWMEVIRDLKISKD